MKPAIVHLLALLGLPFHVGAESSVWDAPTKPLAKPVAMTVYRSPSCDCCGRWIEHMEKHGFVIKDMKTSEMDSVKKRLGVPEVLQSCHTAEVGGYVVEGHVPAADVKKILKAQAKLLGLAAPGMPSGSPGMEMGGKKDQFTVIAFDKQGNADAFQEYNGN